MTFPIKCYPCKISGQACLLISAIFEQSWHFWQSPSPSVFRPQPLPTTTCHPEPQPRNVAVPRPQTLGGGEGSAPLLSRFNTPPFFSGLLRRPQWFKPLPFRSRAMAAMSRDDPISHQCYPCKSVVRLCLFNFGDLWQSWHFWQSPLPICLPTAALTNHHCHPEPQPRTPHQLSTHSSAEVRDLLRCSYGSIRHRFFSGLPPLP